MLKKILRKLNKQKYITGEVIKFKVIESPTLFNKLGHASLSSIEHIGLITEKIDENFVKVIILKTGLHLSSLIGEPIIVKYNPNNIIKQNKIPIKLKIFLNENNDVIFEDIECDKNLTLKDLDTKIYHSDSLSIFDKKVNDNINLLSYSHRCGDYKILGFTNNYVLAKNTYSKNISFLEIFEDFFEY